MKNLKEILIGYWRCIAFAFKESFMFFAGVMAVSTCLSLYAEHIVFIALFGGMTLALIVLNGTCLWLFRIGKWLHLLWRSRGFVHVTIEFIDTVTGIRRSFSLHLPKEIERLSYPDLSNVVKAQLRGQF